jgi:Uma2 family endonuclease
MYLNFFVIPRKLGFVTSSDSGYVINNERYIPDVGFISIQRQPKPWREAYLNKAPDLAVEVISPTDEHSKVRAKVVNYLRAGTIVWLVDPDAKQIEVYMPNAAPFTLGLTDTLNGGTLLPEFSVAVSELFPEE